MTIETSTVVVRIPSTLVVPAERPQSLPMEPAEDSPTEIAVLRQGQELKYCIQHLFPEPCVSGDGSTIHDRNARSAPGSRTCSFKGKPKENVLDVPREKHRRNSMPQTSDNHLSVVSGREHSKKEPLRRVRSFKTTSKGIINRGDSFRRKNEDLAPSSGRVQIDSELEINYDSRQRNLSNSSDSSSVSSNLTGYYKVAVLGATGVGKTALVNQFMSSEHNGAFDISNGGLDDDEMKISVLLNGEESLMEFIEIEESQRDLESYQADAYVVMYSFNDRHTYDIAVDYLHILRTDLGSDRVVILVGNKVDLVRKRLVSEKETRLMAEQYNCKCTDISAGLKHNVDELLVGILRQIRLNLCPFIIDEHKNIKRQSSGKGPKRFFSKLFRKSNKKNCENLYEP